jgi:protein-disulfide isomerase
MSKIFTRAAFVALPLLIAACGGANSAAETKDAGKAAAGAAAAPRAATKAFDATDIVLGADAARVTVVEYASVTCPHCADFHAKIYPEIKAKYIDTGKVNFVFREFPTYPEFKSYLGSMLARCAGEKGGAEAYFLVIGALFDTQKTWVYGDTEAELKKIAAQANIDDAGFAACMQRQDILDAMNKRVETAQKAYDVSATPSFFLNGEKLPSGLDADAFGKRLDEALAKAGS